MRKRAKTYGKYGICVLSAVSLVAQIAPLEQVVAGISADSLRGNLSFIASELLEGRDTPSRGLDVAAEFIAAQFRGAGLAACGDDGYFQTAKMWRGAQPGAGFEMNMRDGARGVEVKASEIAAIYERALTLPGTHVYKARDAAHIKAESVRGNAVLVAAGTKNLEAVAKAALAFDPALFLETTNAEDRPAAARLVDPDEERDVFGDVPRLVFNSGEGLKMLEAAKAGDTGLEISLQLPAPPARVTVRNVIGMLRGSDPVLRNQYVIVSAHYDHLGAEAPDRIYPGANDDGSGTVSVIEIAKALAKLQPPPRRSIIFLTFFGEEEGSLGSRYYMRHPVVPLNHTVADLNLEQVGRTDSSAGPEVSNASLTGFTYSNVAQTLQRAGAMTGIKVYKTANDDDYFSRSDNLPFAEHGIPAHTIVVAFEYPDYHAIGDTWQKINYKNMAKVDRMIAVGTWMLANAADKPKWTGTYWKAR